jgi:hypothetical protein
MVLSFSKKALAGKGQVYGTLTNGSKTIQGTGFDPKPWV